MSGLLNFLQGASNAAASNVSAPVDGLAWLLKKAGVNVGTPIGGSDWMRQQGLTAEAPGLGGLLGESVGGVLPMVAAAKAPQIAAGLLKVGENAAARPMLNPQTGAIVVGHGKSAPRAKELAAAQRNAAKPVSKGGLGLRPDNTPMERAKAMGFDTEAVHFSRHGVDVNELDSGKFAIAPFDAVGTHVGPANQAMDRFSNTVGYKIGNPSYANDELKAVTYPVRIKTGKQMLSADGAVMSETPISMRFSETADYGDLRSSNAALRDKIFSEFDSIPYVNEVESPGQISHIVPPKNIRSRFAAFDPFKKDSADLLASIGGMGLLSPFLFDRNKSAD